MFQFADFVVRQRPYAKPNGNLPSLENRLIPVKTHTGIGVTLSPNCGISIRTKMAMPPLNQFKRFDVRELIRRGVEPFPKIWKRANALGAGDGLIVIAPFLPSPLVEKLTGEGFASKVERGSGADWVVYFWREAA